ncbi:GrpB family protein [Pseudovibrio sp. WM33]|uniref:GrpB family protein n=1 Tax=Pseudovibrio sp. WM33 TaxID=1735585 RepID=UPI0007AE96C0|nr:GrpB family protein [Pseudovibrio sp. WM33]KZL26009.1 dephospho-CoA kinase/protein folding accessory domain-containing protein [Pseudovibrio sp. WM33]
MVDYVVPHDPKWKNDFCHEASLIKEGLGRIDIELHHIGSTSVEGILAKPIIDLLGVVSDVHALDTKSDVFEGLGYEIMGAYGIDGRRYFRKMDGAGKRTHHLHIYETGSPHIERHLAFRDYLIAHPSKAAEYSNLKAMLTSADTVTWDSYLDGKEPFILATEQEALEWFRSI